MAVRTIPGLTYFHAACENIDYSNKKVQSKNEHTGLIFDCNFDYLVISPGSQTNTFGVKGVYDNPYVFFLKQLSDARKIRNRLIECFEEASVPNIGAAERDDLLTFVVVGPLIDQCLIKPLCIFDFLLLFLGGGPTNIEFASELHDFLLKDVARWYPELSGHIRVVLVEASGHILGAFHKSLVSFVETLFSKRHVDVRTSTAVKEIAGNVAILSDGSQLKFGALVWSTGIEQVPLVKNAPRNIAKTPQGRLKVDEYLRVLQSSAAKNDSNIPGETPLTPVCGGCVFAMGDCAADSGKPLPALAQVNFIRSINKIRNYY